MPQNRRPPIVCNLLLLVAFGLHACFCEALPRDSDSSPALAQLQGDKQSLCTAVVAALGCDAELTPAAAVSGLVVEVGAAVLDTRLVRDVCARDCERVRHQPKQAQTHRRAVQALSTNDTCSHVDLMNRDPLTEAEIECIFGAGAAEAGIEGACLNPATPLPLWASLLGTCLLVVMSGFCSGLTLGLMGLDMTM